MARRAAEEWGVLSLSELRACGLRRDAVGVRVRNGRLHRVHRGVYAVGHANLSLEGRWLAAVKACGPRSALSHFAAAALFGFVAWDGRRIEVTIPTATKRAHDGIVAHRTSTLVRRDLTREKGIPCTSPARTLLDLASVIEGNALRRAVRQAQSLHRVNQRLLVEVYARFGPCRGSATLAEIVATGPAPTRSVLEDIVFDLIDAGGLARPEVNVAMTIEGRRVIPDFRWPEQRLVVEADGAAWHEGKLAREADAERQALLEAAGETVLRVTWFQALSRPAQTLARLRAGGAPERRSRPTLIRS